MNREEYLEKLRLALAQMPAEEKERQIAYYDELISDMCEDGMSETEATAKLGDPGKVAEELLAALPLGTLVKSRIKSAGGLSALTIALLVLGFPLWFPLLIAAFAVVLSLFIVLWCVPLAFWAAFIGCAVGAAGSLFGLVLLLFHGTVTARLAALAAVLVLTGVSILLFFVCRGVTRGTFFLTKKTGTGILSLFAGKER